MRQIFIPIVAALAITSGCVNAPPEFVAALGTEQAASLRCPTTFAEYRALVTLRLGFDVLSIFTPEQRTLIDNSRKATDNICHLPLLVSP